MSAGTARPTASIVPAGAQGQRQPRVRRLEHNLGHRDEAARAVRDRAIIELSAPVANLFNRAEEGIRRRDWKLAVDSLQRIIDDPEGCLVRATEGAIEGGVLFESARRQATRWLAELPPEGLTAYRLLYDGRAKGLFEKARATSDSSAMRMIVERYLLSRYGDDAADVLASEALDAGRPAEAIGLIEAVVGLVPDPDVPEERLTGKLAVAHAMLGRTLRAQVLAAEGQVPGWLRLAVAEADKSLSQNARSVAPRGLKPAAQAGFGISPKPPNAAAGAWAPEPTSWPMIGGGASRRGAMPAVRPTFADTLPWWFEHPAKTTRLWEKFLAERPSDPLVLPAYRLVVEDQRVFVRTPDGCVALNAEDLALIWEISAGRDDLAWAGRSAGEGAGAPARWGARAIPDFEDHVAGAVGVSHGLVMILEVGEQGIDGLLGTRGLFFRRGDGVPLMRSNRLAAYDVATGEVRWRRGGTFAPDDPLGRVEFRSVPIGVGDALWVPYLNQNDLFMAVIDPAEGALLRSILLCSVQEPWRRLDRTLPPAQADGIVFVPSGHGLLFAIDLHEYLPRWAARYTVRAAAEEDDPSSLGQAWLSSPPVVAGGLVLLTPVDADELLAFDAWSGAFRWSARVDRAAYIVAADDRQVWLGGSSVTCLSLIDGGLQWATPLSAAVTGRAVLAGDAILAPTQAGLTIIDAQAGEILAHRFLPGSQPPLGDIVCLNSATFSLDSSGVRKFPDLGRMYPEAVTRQQGDPSDVVAALRLAWLELMRDEPQRAYDVLEDVPAFGSEREVARVRVEALLGLARRAPDGGPRALDLIDRAARAARSAVDRLRCGLALADRLTALGRDARACRVLWTLGLSADADQRISLGDHVEGAARLEITRRLREIEPRLPEEQLAEGRDSIKHRVAAALDDLNEAERGREAADLLRAVADLPDTGAVTRRAKRALADWELRHAHYESAERYLGESARPHEVHAGPAGAEPGPVSGTEAVATGLGEPAPRWLAPSWSLRLPVNRVTDISAPFKVPDELEGALSSSFGEQLPPRLVHFDGKNGDVLADRVISHVVGDWLYCQRISDGGLLWHTRLRLSEAFEGDVPISYGAPGSRPRRAVIDGQIGVFNSLGGLLAVGLVTGKRLWVRSYDAPVAPDESAGADMAMAARDGLLAAVPHAGRLTLLRVWDGATVWERELGAESVTYVWMRGGFVVTADSLLERVQVVDRVDGSLVQQTLFRQPFPESHLVTPVFSDEVVVGPECTPKVDAVVAVDLSSGDPVWRMRLDKPLGCIFEPAEGHVGIGLLGGDVRVVRAGTGEIVLERRVPGAGVVIDGRLVAGTLIMKYVRAGGEERRRGLEAVDVATGEARWQREDLVPAEGVSEKLRVVEGRMPVVVRYADADEGLLEGMAVALIDVRTGESVGRPVPIPDPLFRIQFNGDRVIGPDGVVVGTTKGVFAFSMEAPGANAGGGS